MLEEIARHDPDIVCLQVPISFLLPEISGSIIKDAESGQIWHFAAMQGA
jgi:hypothetical protein